MKEVQHWDIFGLMSIIQIDRSGIDIMIMKVKISMRDLKRPIFLVTESKWEDVFEAGIGGNCQEQRVPSAYLLVYINNEQKSLSNGLFI
jgi:hypothetical protein